jgi:hypothetical protein
MIAVAVEEYPVYHSLYDDYVWVERFGDPLFHRRVAGTEPSIFKETFKFIPSTDKSIFLA